MELPYVVILDDESSGNYIGATPDNYNGYYLKYGWPRAPIGNGIAGMTKRPNGGRLGDGTETWWEQLIY